MSNEIEVFALTSAIEEITNVYPEVSNLFIFLDDGTLLAMNENTKKQTATQTVKTLQALCGRTKAIGDFESATFYSDNNNVNVTRINDYYLAMTVPGGPEEKTAKTISEILIPTVLKLAERINANLKEESSRVDNAKSTEETSTNFEKTSTNRETEEIGIVKPEPLKEQQPLTTEIEPDPPAAQFLVENAGRFNRSSSKVYIDSEFIQKWNDLYADQAITQVDLETLNGETIRCKFGPIKGSKNKGKGIIQLPKKAQEILHVVKGELVVVKPVID